MVIVLKPAENARFLWKNDSVLAVQMSSLVCLLDGDIFVYSMLKTKASTVSSNSRGSS